MRAYHWLRNLFPKRSRTSTRRKRQLDRESELPRLGLKRLEERRVLNADAAPVEVLLVDAGDYADDGQADTFVVDYESDQLTVSVNGESVYSGDADGVSGIQILGSGDNDVLVADLFAGSRVLFDGGGGDDTLVLEGDQSATSVAYQITGSQQATIEAHSANGLAEVEYRGVERVADSLDAATREFSSSVGLTLGESNTPNFDAQIVVGSAAGTAIDFKAPTDSLTLNTEAAEGAGDIEVRGYAAVSGSDLSVHSGGAGLLFSGDINLDGGDLTATGGSIVLEGSTTSHNASFDFEAQDSLTVESDALLVNHGGEIALRGSEITQLGDLLAERGSVLLDSGDTGVTIVEGLIDVSTQQTGAVGGSVQVLGMHVGLFGAALIDASGAAGGGRVNVGGGYQGSDPSIRNAKKTIVGTNSAIRADAIADGEGGEVVVWADEFTRFYGDISARGGALGGDGGSVEVSGKIDLDYKGDVDTLAPHGAAGSLLLDPDLINIVDGLAGSGDHDQSNGDLTNGNISFNDANAGTNTLSVGQINATGATTGLVINAGQITFNNTANIVMGVGFSIAFTADNTAHPQSAGGDSTITNAGGNAFSITVSGGAISFTAGGLIDLTNITFVGDVPTINSGSPTVTSVTVDSDPVSDSDLTQVVTVNFSEAMEDDGSADPVITFSAGTWTSNGDGAFNGPNTQWTETFTLTDNNEDVTDVTIDVTGTEDADGNAQQDYTPEAEFDIDTLNPTVTSVTVDTDPVTDGDLAQLVTVTFNEAMEDDGSADPNIVFSAGTWTSNGDGAFNGAGTIWTETYTLTDNNEDITGVTIDVTGAEDAAGNAQQDYTPEAEFDIDTLGPMVSSVTVDTDPVTDGDLTQLVTVTFNETMLDDGSADPTITFSAGTWTSNGDGAFNGAGTIWTETFTLTDNDEEVTGVTIDVTGAQDVAGNAQQNYTPEAEFDINTAGPSVTSVTVDSDPITDADLVQVVTVTFDQAMLDDGSADPNIVFSSGTWTSNGDGAYNGADLVWTESFTLTDNGEMVTGVTIDVTGARAAGGNLQSDYTPEAEFDLDTLNPTVTSVMVDTDPIFEGDLMQVVTVNFSEAMLDDGSADPTIVFSAGAWVSNGDGAFNGAGTIWTETFTTADNDEDITGVTIDVTGARDAVGNLQQDYTPEAEFDIDTVKPLVNTVTVDTPLVTDSDLTQVVTVTFNEAMEDDGSADPTIVFSAGTWTSSGDGAFNGAGTIWTETFTLTDNNEDVTGVTIDVTGAQDAAGNAQEDYTPEAEFDIDTLNPSVTSVTVDSDPITDADLVQVVTITFDQAMTVDGSADPTIIFSAGTWVSAGDGAFNGAGTVWTETFTVTDNNEMVSGVTIDVTGARDANGNLQNDYTPEAEFDLDTLNPTVMSVTVDTDPIYEGDLVQVVTVNFSEAMLADGSADPTILFSAGTWISSGDGAFNGAGTIWTETFTTADNDEDITGVTIDVTGTRDAVGNLQQDYTPEAEFDIDTVKPLVNTVTVDTDPVYDGDLTQVVTVTFNEAMEDDGSADPTITFSAGTWVSSGDGAFNGTDTVWTETFTLVDNNEDVTGVTIDVTGTQDAAGNVQEDYTPEAEFDIDTLNPSVTSVTVDTAENYDGDLTQVVTVTFSEAMNLGAAPVLTFSEGTWTNNGDGAFNVAGTVWTVTYTLTDNDEDFTGVTIDVTGAEDAAGNPQNDYTPEPEFDLDTLNPTVVNVTPSVAVVSDALVGIGTFTLTVDYSEAMNTGVNPTITFPVLESPLNTIMLNAGLSFWLDADTFVAVYDVVDADETIADIDVIVNGAQDVAGNVQVMGTAPDEFSIDSSNPFVAMIERVDSDYTNAPTVDFRVTFSEIVTDVDINDFGLTTDVTGASIVSVVGALDTYIVTVGTGTSDGTINLDLATPTINDLVGNPLNDLTVAGVDETYTMGTTEVLLTAGELSIDDIRTATADNLTLTIVGGVTLQIDSAGSPIAIGAGVTRIDSDTVQVLLASITGTTGVTINPGDLNDTINVHGAERGLVVDGQAGTDAVNLLTGPFNTNGANLSVTAETVTQAAASTITTNGGAVDITTQTGALVVNAAISSGAGDITLNANLNSLTNNAAVTSTAGAVTVTALGSVAQNADISTGGAGVIGVTSTLGSITMDPAASTTAANGNITYAAGFNVAVSSLSTTADVAVTATSGAISDVSVGDASSNIAANAATLMAATGIGSGAGDLNELADLDLAVGGLSATNTASGHVQLTNAGDLAITTISNGAVANGSRNVVLDVAGAVTDGDDTLTDIVGGNAVLRTTSFGVMADALETAITNLEGTATGGGLFLQNSQTLNLTNTSAVLNGAAGGLTATGGIGVELTAGDLNAFAPVTATDDVSLAANLGNTTLAAGAPVTSNTGSVTLEAGGDLVINADVDAMTTITANADADANAAGDVAIAETATLTTSSGTATGIVLAADVFTRTAPMTRNTTVMALTGPLDPATIEVIIASGAGTNFVTQVDFRLAERPGAIPAPQPLPVAGEIEIVDDLAAGVTRAFATMYDDNPEPNSTDDIRVAVSITQLGWDGGQATIQLNRGGLDILTLDGGVSIILLIPVVEIFSFVAFPTPLPLPTAPPAPTPVPAPVAQVTAVNITPPQSGNSAAGLTSQGELRYYELRIVELRTVERTQELTLVESPQERINLNDPRLKAINKDGETFNPSKLPELFKRLPGDRYRIYLIEDGAERLMIEFVIEQVGDEGRPVELPERIELDQQGAADPEAESEPRRAQAQAPTMLEDSLSDTEPAITPSEDRPAADEAIGGRLSKASFVSSGGVVFGAAMLAKPAEQKRRARADRRMAAFKNLRLNPFRR